MKVSSSVAAARKAQMSRRRSSTRAVPSRRGAINFAWFGDFSGRHQTRPGIEQKIFYKMAMKPIPQGQLKKQGFDLEAGVKNLSEQFGIDPKLVEIKEVRVGKNSVKVVLVKQPDFGSTLCSGEGTAAVIVPGQHGNVVKTIDTGEVKKHWDDGKNVVLATFRGYHGNPGEIDHRGQAQDLAAILSYINDSMRIKPENTSIYAHSMGCDTFVNANAIRAEQAQPHNYGYIELRAPYQSMAKMIEHKIQTKWYLKPFRKRIPEILVKLADITMNSFANLKHLSARKMRIIASPIDKKVPFVQSEAVRDEIHRLSPTTHLVFEPITDYASGDHDSVCFPHYPEHLSSKGSQ